MSSIYTTQSNQTIMLGSLLAQGGEGSIWSVVGRPEVAKIFHPSLDNTHREAKITLMLSNPPRDEMRARLNHVSIAWPTALLYQDARFAGFLMPRLGESLKILEVYNPRLRKATGFNWKYLLHMAINLSVAVDAIHSKGYVIGDINESNILVNRQALVSLIDTDSFQVHDGSGLVYRCPVGREEFTPPELQGIQFNQVDRSPEHDYFGLAVMIFLLLMEGNHPFSGILKTTNPTGDPDNIYCLKQGAFPYASNSLSGPRPTAPKFTILPTAIQRLMLKCFVEGYRTPSIRPAPGEWKLALEKIETNLIQCRKDNNHWYSGHLRKCPWCASETPHLQTPLPAVQPISVSEPQARRPAPPPRLRSKPALSFQAASINPALPSQSINYPPKSALGIPVVRDRLKRFVYGSRISRLTFNQWWHKTWLSILIGTASGAVFSFAILLMFWYPDFTSLFAGTIAGVTVFLPIFYFGRPIYNHLQRTDNPFGKLFGIVVSLIGLSIAGLAFYFAWKQTAGLLGSYQPRLVWLILESCLLGTGGGAAFGTYRFFSRPKGNWTAVLWLAFITILTLLILVLLGMQFMPFKTI